jgi:hypothetical protein
MRAASCVPHHRRRLSDKILIAFHPVCDQAEFEAAERLLNILDTMTTAQTTSARPARQRATAEPGHPGRSARAALAASTSKRLDFSRTGARARGRYRDELRADRDGGVDLVPGEPPPPVRARTVKGALALGMLVSTRGGAQVVPDIRRTPRPRRVLSPQGHSPRARRSAPRGETAGKQT